VNSNVKVVVIGKSASPWLTVGKADGEAPSNKVALAETACIGRQLLADWKKVMFVWQSNVAIERFHGVQCSCACQHSNFLRRGARHRANRMGDRAEPCLTPTLEGNSGGRTASCLCL
jgi:hypothetical protein